MYTPIRVIFICLNGFSICKVTYVDYKVYKYVRDCDRENMFCFGMINIIRSAYGT